MSRTNVRVNRDEVRAGEYELLDDHWDELVNDYPFGEDRVPRLVRHYKGETVHLDEDHAFRMLRGGSVAPAGQRQELEARRALAQARAALANLPPALRDKFAEDEEVLALLARPRTSVVAEGINEGHPRYANATLGDVVQPVDAEHPSGTSVDVQEDDADEAGGVDTTVEGRPGRNASTAEWREYAVSGAPEDQRLTEEEAAGRSRDELRDQFGG